MEEQQSFDPHQQSIVDFVKQELQAHAIILREVIVSIQNHQQVSDFLEVALKSIQSLINVIKIVHLDIFLPLLDALKSYFESLSEDASISEGALEFLSLTIGELAQLGSVKGGQLQEIIQSRMSVYEHLISKLRSFTDQQLALSSAMSRQDKQGGVKKINEPLIRMFSSELQAQIYAMDRALATLKEGNPSQELLEKWAKSHQAIRQAAYIIKLDPIINLGESLEEYLQAILDGEIPWSSETFNLLIYIVDIFKRLANSQPQEFDQILKGLDPDIKELIVRLKEAIQHQTPVQLLNLVIEKEVSPSESASQPLASFVSSEIALDHTMFDLFRVELETQVAVLNEGLIASEHQTDNESLLESLMRAAHSIKGAARILNLTPLVKLAHAMEDCFVAAQNHELKLDVDKIDVMLQAVDLFSRLCKLSLGQFNAWLQQQLPAIENLIHSLSSLLLAEKYENKPLSDIKGQPSKSLEKIQEIKKRETIKPFQTLFAQDRILRVTAQNLNRLMGLAGESLVESRWLYPFEAALQNLKKKCTAASGLLDNLRDNLRDAHLNDEAQKSLEELHSGLNECHKHLNDRLADLDSFIRRHASLSDRLYQEVINSRMRPFADGVEGLPRLVRDLARQLGKRVKLEIKGTSTPVDRDILEKLEVPLSHLLRNAVDHGIEYPSDRQNAKKPIEGLIVLEAHHRGGGLEITVSDDGRGINLAQLRENIIEKNLASRDMTNRLSEIEVLDFLFLPGFSTANQVTEISGRGVGLDIVQSTVKELGGIVKINFKEGKGLSIHLQLPLTLSVIRALLVEISGEIYAFPLARVEQIFLIARNQIELIEGRQFFQYDKQNIGLVPAWQVLELEESQVSNQELSVVVLNDRLNLYGLAVDRLIGEKELVVQELDLRLGKVTDISAGALIEDGTPVLIIDIEDIMRSIDNLLSRGRLTQIAYKSATQEASSRKRVLVVDDSLTVREVECRLLENQGYEVETAVNGMDGWNAVRIGKYDLVITDIDMPRMNGIDLIKAIKSDSRLKNLPVMIVTYKEREEDRLKGLEAGANYYLTKSSFHDATLLEAVHDLIGNP